MRFIAMVMGCFMILGSIAAYAKDSEIPSFKSYVHYQVEMLDLYLDPALAENAKATKGKTYWDDHMATIKVQFPFKGNHVLSVSYDPGPSDDPSFAIQYRGHTELLGGEILYISTSGFFYLETTTDECFHMRRKYIWFGGEFKEITQPLYLIDSDCTTSTRLVVYEKKCNKGHAIATLPEGSTVHIIAVDAYGKGCSPETVAENNIRDKVYNFLVSTPFGLTGWVASSCGYMMRPGKPLSCIRYNGD